MTALTTGAVIKSDQEKGLTQNLAALANLSVRQLKAISVISLAYELAGYGGTNYSAPAVQLNQDASVLFGGIELLAGEETKNKTLIQTALDWNAARFKVTTSISTDVNTLLALYPALVDLPEDQLNRMIFTLRYKLSVLSV